MSGYMKKQSLYFPQAIISELEAEATRLDRSVSWVMQQAWRIARGTLRTFPSANDSPEQEALPDPREEAARHEAGQGPQGSSNTERT